MRWIAVRLTRLIGVVTRRRDHGLEDELDEHLRYAIDDNIRAGMTTKEARRQAALALGGVEQAKEQQRDASPFAWIDHMWRETTRAMTFLRRHPSIALVSIASLASAIAVAITVARVVDALFLHPFPVPQLNEIAAVYGHTYAQPHPNGVSYPDYLDYKSRLTTVSGLAAYYRFSGTVDVHGVPERLAIETVSDDYFSVLGIPASLGRVFAVGAHATGRAVNEAVLSDRLWRRVFHGSSDALGARVRIGSTLFTVIGVAPKNFSGVRLDFADQPELWIALDDTANASASLARAPLLTGRQFRWLLPVARLRPDRSLDNLNAELSLVAQQLAAAYPTVDRDWTTEAFSGSVYPERRQSTITVAVTLGVVAILMLVAATLTVATFVLTQMDAARKNIALQLALGAKPWQVLWPWISLTLAIVLLGGATGALGSAVLLRALSGQLLPFGAAGVHLGLAFDHAAFVYTGAIAAAVAAALVPIVALTLGRRVAALSSTGFGAAALKPHGSTRTRTALLILHVGCSVALLAWTFGLALELSKLMATRAPFPGEQTLLASFDPVEAGYSTSAHTTYVDRLLNAARNLPGARVAATTSDPPFGHIRSQTRVTTFGSSPHEGLLRLSVVSPSYFEALGFPMAAGRAIADADHQYTAPVVVVNQSAAAWLNASGDVLGQRLGFADQDAQRVVIGIVRDDLYEPPDVVVPPRVYVPMAQSPPRAFALCIRTNGSAAALTRSVAQLASLGVPAYDVRTLTAQRDETLVEDRYLRGTAACAALVALLLALCGLANVVSHDVLVGLRDIGIRVAVGASTGRAMWPIVRRFQVLSVTGAALGAAIAFGLRVVVQGHALSPEAVIGSVLLMLVSGAAVCYLAAFAQIRTFDPIRALRSE